MMRKLSLQQLCGSSRIGCAAARVCDAAYGTFLEKNVQGLGSISASASRGTLQAAHVPEHRIHVEHQLAVQSR